MLNSIVSLPTLALASMIAVRKVVVLLMVSALPSPGNQSGSSPAESTVNTDNRRRSSNSSTNNCRLRRERSNCRREK